MQKHVLRLLLVAAMLLPWATKAQSLDDLAFSTGIDTSLWIQVPTSNPSLISAGAGDYGVSTVQNLGFAFTMGEGSYTQFSVNADGNLKLGSTVTGTSSYTTPFSSSYANANNPKINFFGCDGYCDANHYVRYMHTEDANGDSLGVVEFCMGTYTTSTRSNLYKWQVHLYHNGKIQVVFGAAPAVAPAVARQQGICTSASDGFVVDQNHVATHFTNGSSTSIPSGNWPTEGRYYRFEEPVYSCPRPIEVTVSNLAADAFDIAWTDTTDASSWIVTLAHGIDTLVAMDTTNSYSFINLSANSTYMVAVQGLCQNGDTSMARTLEVRTLCSMIDSLPYFNDFENELVGGTATGSVFVDCWTRLNNGTSNGGYPYVSSTASYNHTTGGARGLYWYSSTTSGTYGDYHCAVLPPVDTAIYPIDTLQLSFWAKATSASYHPEFIVGVLTNPNDINSFTAVDTINNFTDQWALYEVPLANYNGYGQYVAIKGVRGGATWNAAVDDVTLGFMPACPRVHGMAASNVTSDEATLTWDALGNATSWNIEYGPAGFTVGEGVSDVASDTTITLYSLMGNSLYDVYIVADCGSETSDTTFFQFRTACVAIDSLPYTYGFEDAEVGTSSNVASFAPCYVRLNNGTSYGGYPYVSSTASYNHTPGGARGLYWYNAIIAGTYGDYQCVVLPAIDTDMFPINTLRLKFWSRPSTTSYSPQFRVGVMTDPTDINTFTQVATVNVLPQTTWQEVEALFATYTGYGQYIAIRADRPASLWYAYVDDITLDLAPQCPDVVDASASTTAGAALVEWNYNTALGVVPESYDVSYAYASDPTNTIGSMTVNEPTVLLTNLESDSAYVVSIAASCDGGVLGNPTTLNFHTQALPCSEWDTTGVGGSSSPAATYTIGTPGTSATNVMPVNCGNVYSYANHLVLASEINSGAVHLSGIDFDYVGTSAMANATNCSIYLCHTSMVQCDNFVDPTNFQLVYVGPLNCTTTGWNHFEFNRGTFAYNGTSNIMVGVVKNGTGIDANGSFNYQTTSPHMSHRVANDATPYDLAAMAAATASNSFWRPNMRLTAGGNGGYDCISQATCAQPLAWNTDIRSDEADFRWIPGYQETSWDVDYREQGSSTWTTVATGISDDSVTVYGLNANTQYEVRIGAICSDTTIYTTVAFRTPCGGMALPFSEDFETFSTTVADPLPACWTKHTNYTTNYPYASTSYHHSGSKAMYMYSTSTSYSLMALPQMAAAIDSLQVSFWLYKSTSSYPHELYVGVMSDPDDISTFVAVDTVSCANLSTWEAFEVSFANYTGTGRYITFYSPDNAYSYPYLDDVAVDYIPACPRITNVTARDITGTDATIAWTASDAGNYEVEYGVSGFAHGTGTLVTTISDDSLAITGLTANTAYDVYVRGICDVDSSLWSFVYTFRTACGVIDALPYVEDFESQPTGTSTSASFVTCWNRLNNGTSYFGYPYVSNSSSYNHTAGGSRGLYWYGSTTTGTYGDYQVIVLPQVDTMVYPMNTLQLKFWTRATGTTYAPVLQVGVMTDPTDQASFQAIDTINISGTTWVEVEVPFSTFTGHGAYPAIKATRPTTSWYCNVDDVTLDLIPDCQHVDNVHSTIVGLTSATVVWGVLDATQNDFEVRYGVSGCDVDTLTTIYVSGVDTIGFTGLDSNTSYDVFVRPDCGGSYSPWMMTTFRTLTASPVSSFPYSCDFEGAEANAWDIANGDQTNKWFVGTATQNGGTHSLYISNDYGISNVYTNSAISYVWAYRTFVMSAGEYAYSFDWKALGESANYDYLRVFLVPAGDDLQAGHLPGEASTYSFATAVPPANWIDLSQKTTAPYTLNQQSTWQTVNGTFNVPAGTYNLAFVWANDGSGGSNPPAAVDNIFVNVNTCAVPIDLTVTNVTSDSIALAWNTTGTENEWFVNWGTGSATVYDSSYVITGLTPSTLYNIRVSTVCSASDTSLPASVSASTLCLAVSLPYFENFDSYAGATTAASGVYPNCWDYVLTGSSTYTTDTYKPIVYASTTYAHSGSNALRLYGVGYFSLPPVDAPLDSVELSFWNYTTSAYYGLEVGVMEGNTFMPIQDVTAPSVSSHVQTTVYFTGYTGTSRTIAFRNYYTTSTTTGYSYNYLDDVQVRYIPTCLPVTNIHSAGVSESSITVDWTDRTAASSWIVEYGPAGHTFGTGTMTTVTSHPFTVNGLDTMSSYEFYVRAICSATDTGDWSESASLSTSFCSDAHVANIGSTASSSTAYHYPVNNFYKYTLSETIIDSAELGGAQDISMISYYYAYATATTSKTNCSIYLQPTTLSAFATTSDVVALDTATAVLVYTGALNCSEGWNHFTFDTPYSYDGHGNLLVIVDDNSNAYNGSAYVFKTAPCTGNKTLVYYSDSADPDAMNPSTFTGSKAVYTARTVMMLTSCDGASCAAPVITGETHDYESATITWSGNGTSFQVAVKANGAADWPAETTVTGNTHTFTGLLPATAYSFRVRQDCSADSNGYSEWAMGTFTTDSLPCFAPENLTVSNITNDGATFAWTAMGAETNWELHVWNTGVNDITVPVNTNPATVTGLVPGVTYNAAVRALCGSALVEGDWSETITFTTQVCPDVTGLATSNVTFNSVNLSWDNNSMAQSYVIEYGYQGFSQGQGTTVNVNTNSYQVTGLDDETAYDFFVRAVCGTDWTSENWVRVTATTASRPDDVYTVTLNVNDPTMGTVTGAGQYAAGTTVTISASANDGYQFVNWSDGNTEATRQIVVNSDITLTATFASAQGIDEVNGVSCTIYPNPATTAATISVAGANGMVRISVVDMNGRVVATETIECAADCEKTMDVDNLAQGAYFVRITGENVNMVKKLVVR